MKTKYKISVRFWISEEATSQTYWIGRGRGLRLFLHSSDVEYFDDKETAFSVLARAKEYKCFSRLETPNTRIWEIPIYTPREKKEMMKEKPNPLWLLNIKQKPLTLEQQQHIVNNFDVYTHEALCENPSLFPKIRGMLIEMGYSHAIQQTHQMIFHF
jgi:hypothetical protein